MSLSRCFFVNGMMSSWALLPLLLAPTVFRNHRIFDPSTCTACKRALLRRISCACAIVSNQSTTWTTVKMRLTGFCKSDTPCGLREGESQQMLFTETQTARRLLPAQQSLTFMMRLPRALRLLDARRLDNHSRRDRHPEVLNEYVKCALTRVFPRYKQRNTTPREARRGRRDKINAFICPAILASGYRRMAINKPRQAGS